MQKLLSALQIYLNWWCTRLLAKYSISVFNFYEIWNRLQSLENLIEYYVAQNDCSLIKFVSYIVSSSSIATAIYVSILALIYITAHLIISV